jgi:hypothetical protein
MNGEDRMSMAELLDQSEIWQAREDGNLVLVRIDEMTESHIENLRGWLLSNSGRIYDSAYHSLYQAGTFFSGGNALDSIDAEMAAMDSVRPSQWMQGQPLFQALGKRLEELQRARGRS